MTPAPAQASGKRVFALDVLRGIAAMIVLLGHCTLVYGLPEHARRVIDIALNQRAAVLIFFVLSGYVLTYVWLRLRDEPHPYWRFYLRRFFRLMPALWVATALALVLLWSFPLGSEPHLSPWLLGTYRPVSVGHAIRSFFALDDAVVIPPTWTITVEILGSIAMPFLVGVIERQAWTAWVTVAVLAGISLLVAEWYSRFAFAAFGLQFACGVALALYLRTRTLMRGYVLAAAGLTLLFGSRPLLWLLLTGELQPMEYRVNAALPALFETAGATLLVAALASGRSNWTAAGTPLRALGDWSYSIYLIHFPVLRLLAYAIPPMRPVVATLILAVGTVAITCALAAIIFRFIEKPGIAIGMRVTRLPERQA